MFDNSPITIIIADDHPIVRTGIKFTIKENFNVTVYETSKEPELFDLVKAHRPNLILLDINVPDMNSQSVLEHLLVLDPEMNVLMFSMNKEEIYGKLYLRLGARGYLQKDTNPSEIVKAIKCVLSGNVYIRKEMQALYLGDNSMNGGRIADSPYACLGKKELKILLLLTSGDSLTNIARTMNLSPSTIGTHKANIFSKLHISNNIELMEFVNLHPLN